MCDGQVSQANGNITVLSYCICHSCESVYVLVVEEKYLTLEGFHKFTLDRARQDIRNVWRAILACGYDLHFDRLE